MPRFFPKPKPSFNPSSNPTPKRNALRTLLALSAVTLAALTGSLAAQTQAQTQAQAAPAPVSSEPLKVYVTPTPQGDILRYVQQLANQDRSGLKLKVIESNQGLDANQLLYKGDVDATLLQHRPFFDSWVAAHPEAQGRLVNAATLLVNVFGLYSSRYASLQDIPDGAALLVPNEQTNLPRALFILQQAGLLELSHPQSDGSSAALAIDEKHITANPRHLKFIPTETRLRAKSLPDVEASFINGDIALTHDIDPQSALALEDKHNNPYANVLTTRTELLEDPRIQQLTDYLLSDAVAAFINDNYRGFVVPDQKRLQP
ncbi:MetQ/NlpA family ABC transporter substrate-binding protein [Kerstersia sp.]|uniref:MetQ/NlpA family ABC transporter substrate-binding protein n=1 Tax=Kerstersia sp. TaxID=1930783 RepID=UPI003F8E3BB3